jgi:hypothetical protein
MAEGVPELKYLNIGICREPDQLNPQLKLDFFIVDLTTKFIEIFIRKRSVFWNKNPKQSFSEF